MQNYYFFHSKQANNYADVFYTADWPESYKSGKIFDCKVNITHGDKNKVIFMDADLKIPSADKCNKDLDDHVSIRGNFFFIFGKAIFIK